MLGRGVADRRSPLHSPALATRGARGPSVRTVVLRGVDREARLLTCHSDARSAKVAELSQDGRAAWMFYASKSKTQLRLAGSTVVHRGNARTQARWNALTPSSRRCYCTELSPGSPLSDPGSGLPLSLTSRAPTAQESDEQGKPHFVVIDTTVEEVDWLWLSWEGHRRARFEWDGSSWQSQWLVP